MAIEMIKFMFIIINVRFLEGKLEFRGVWGLIRKWAMEKVGKGWDE